MSPVQAARKYPEVLAALLAAGGLSWWWTAERMAGMNAAPGADLGTLGWFAGTWALMMAAMMLPSFGPTLAAFLTAARVREPSRWLLFTCGYLLVWAVAGIVGYALFAAGKALLAGDLGWHSGGRWLSAAVLGAAAAYELVPFKQGCLTRCRGQLGGGRVGSGSGRAPSLAMGARSGLWCLGCSWALMAALFALGVMSLTWMVVIATLVAVEKVGPWPRAARLATAGVLALLALGILIAPDQVPGLVIPGSGGMHAMNAMS
jgi:predicted metal-binding membrane protein